MGLLNSIKVLRSKLLEPGEKINIRGGEIGLKNGEFGNLGTVSSEKISLMGNRIESVERIETGEQEIASGNIISSENRNFLFSYGVIESQIGKIGNIRSRGRGVSLSRIKNIGEIHSVGTSVHKSVLDGIDSIFSGSIGVYQSFVKDIGTVVTKNDGIYESELDTVKEIYSGRDAIYRSVVRKVDKIFSDYVGVYGSEIDTVDSIFSGVKGVFRSDVGTIKKIISENQGIKNSTIGSVGEIISKKTAIYDSDIGFVGGIESESHGIIDSTLDEVERITSGYSSIKNSEIKSVGTVISKHFGISGSKIGFVDEVLSRLDGIYKSYVDNVSDVYSKGNGVSNSEIYRIGKIKAEKSGILKSRVKNIGSIESKETGVYKSVIDKVGSIKSGRIGIYDSEIGVVGDIHSSEAGVASSNGIKVYGDLLQKGGRNWIGIYESFMTYVVGDKVEGRMLDHLSYGGLVAAKTIDVDHYNFGISVLTKSENKDFITYRGDWEKLKEELKDDRELLKNLQIFVVNDETVESFEELKELNDSYGEYIEGELSLSDIENDIEHLRFFNFLPDKYYGQMVSSLAKKDDNRCKEKLGSFGDLLLGIRGRMGVEYVNDLFRSLKTEKKEHSLGGDLVEIGLGIEYHDFLDYIVLRDFIRDRLDEEKVEEVIQEDLEFFEDDSPFYEMAKKAISKETYRLSKLFKRGELAGITPSLDTIKYLKGCEGQRKNRGFEKNVDISYIEERLEEEIDTKMREYTIRGLKKLGINEIREEYKRYTGEDKKDFRDDEELVEIVKASKKYIKNRETAGKLLKYKEDIYQVEENREWLMENGFDVERITNFETEYKSTDIDQFVLDERKEKIFLEMKDLINEYGEIVGESFDIGSFKDFEMMKGKIDPPEKKEARKIYKEIFKEKINEYKGVRDSVKGIPEKLKIRVAGPLETINMGNYFSNSCLAIGKSNGWGAVGNAADVNKQVLYAVDKDDRVYGRILTCINKDNKLSYFSVFNNSEASIEDIMIEAVEEYAEHLGLEMVGGEKNVDLLIANEWYTGNL